MSECKGKHVKPKDRQMICRHCGGHDLTFCRAGKNADFYCHRYHIDDYFVCMLCAYGTTIEQMIEGGTDE